MLGSTAKVVLKKTIVYVGLTVYVFVVDVIFRGSKHIKFNVAIAFLKNKLVFNHKRQKGTFLRI